MSTQPVPTAPPGWYPDPTTGQWRWWDGTQWYPLAHPTYVPYASGGPPPAYTHRGDATATWFPTTPTLRLPAAILGIAFVVTLTVAGQLIDLLPRATAAFAGLGLLVVSTLGMPLAAWYGSRRWGTGNFVDDLGLRFRWIDLALGVAGGVALTVVLIVVNVITTVLGVPHGSNLTEVAERGRDVVTFAILFVSAGLVAPITEELLFRGLIQRGLASRWAPWSAVASQALVFGSAHLTPSEGWGNVDLILSLGLMGVGLGALARSTGRLGTSMVAHATFNCIQLSLLWLTLG